VRLDHLLSKECCQLYTLTTTQLNTGYSGALVDRQMNGRLRLLAIGARHSRIGPCGNDRNSHYSVLRERPFGSVPVTSLRRSSEPRGRSMPGVSRALRELLEIWRPSCSRAQVFRVSAVTAHPVRAPVGWFSRCTVRSRAAWFPAPACAVQPLENSKASTSIFVLQATKSQR
jgi:hypothetical protein